MNASRWLLSVCVALAAPVASAQRRPVPPRGQQSQQQQRANAAQQMFRQREQQLQRAQQTPPPSPSRPGHPPPATRQFTPHPPAANTATAQGTAGQAPHGAASCEEVRKNARVEVYFDNVEISKLVQTAADVTCKTFILGDNVRGKISIVGPKNGTMVVSADQFYSAFLAALDANNLTVYPYGKFLKITEKNNGRQTPLPVVGPGEPYSTNEAMITKLFRLKYVDPDQARNILQQLVSRGGDVISIPPDILLINDIGSNMHRLETILRQMDSRTSSDELQVIQVKYASVTDVANTIQKLFEQKPGAGASNAPVRAYAGQYRPPPTGQPPGGNVESAAARGPVVLNQLIPDERTNKLIVMASPAALDRIRELLAQIDVPISGEGRINVYYLENANAEDLASTLQGLAQGTSAGGGAGANRPRTPYTAPRAATPASAQTGAATAELFSGEVKISADKATNSLVVVANQGDYRNLVRVIQKLDRPRNQVFVEAVIMEVDLDHNTDFGINLHQGFTLSTPEGTGTGIAGTSYQSGSPPPSFSLLNLASFGGFLAGIQGPTIPALAKLGIPSFGIVLHALQQSSDVNVLSTPHLLTSDNEEATITVGQNVPFQAGFAPSSLNSALGALGGTTATTGTTGAGALGGLGLGTALGGLGSYYAPINRQNVELKLSIKPQINSGDYVRMVIDESTEEIASTDPVLGPTTSKRSAKTTVVARDQETVVIGGIMQDRTIQSVSKVPLFGDLPIIGHLFRQETHRKVKTNLLLFLTPYIIRDQSDFQRIFERKLAERQQFVEQFYGQVPGYEVAVDFARKGGPFAKINSTVMREEQKVENGGPGTPGERVIHPELPAPGSPGQVSPVHPPGEQAPEATQPAPQVQEPAPTAPQGEGQGAPGGSEQSTPEMTPQPQGIPE